MNGLLNSKGPLTRKIHELGIRSWNELVTYVQKLPYGRNANRHDFELVLIEGKGTCSSKHALLKQAADLNGIEGVGLIMGIYKMTQTNTPGIGNMLIDNGLEYIPEAHCYLKVDGQRLDVTMSQSNVRVIEPDLLEEVEIEPSQVGVFKVSYHKTFLKSWLRDCSIPFSLNKIWEIREQCIESLS